MYKFATEFVCTLIFIFGIMLTIKNVPKKFASVFIGLSLAVGVFICSYFYFAWLL